MNEKLKGLLFILLFPFLLPIAWIGYALSGENYNET